MAVGNFTAGDTKNYNLVFSRNGQAYDITGHTIYMTLKTDNTLPDNGGLPNVLQAQATITDGPNGQASVELVSTDTKQLTPGSKYFYDIQIHDSSSPTVVSTVEKGSITVEAGTTETDGNP